MEKTLIIKLAVLIAAAALAIMILKPFILILLLAATIAYAFYPLHKILTKKIHRLFSALLITSGVLAALILIIQTGTNLALKEMGKAYSVITKISVNNPQIQEIIRKLLENLTNWFSHQILAIPELVISLVMFFIAMFYLMYDGKKFYTSFEKLIPLPKQEKTAIFKKIKNSINSFIYIQILIGLIQAFVAIIGFKIFGLEYVFFGALAAAILSILPMLGSFLLYLSIAAYFIISGQIWLGIGIMIFGIGISGTIDIVLKPIFFGRRIRIHPLITFIGVFGGIKALGISGVILGPVFLSIAYTLFQEFMKTYKNETIT